MYAVDCLESCFPLLGPSRFVDASAGLKPFASLLVVDGIRGRRKKRGFQGSVALFVLRQFAARRLEYS